LCEHIKTSGDLRLAEALGTAINLANDAGGNEYRFWARDYVPDEGKGEI
jgi:hypothetical protein